MVVPQSVKLFPGFPALQDFHITPTTTINVFSLLFLPQASFLLALSPIKPSLLRTLCSFRVKLARIQLLRPFLSARSVYSSRVSFFGIGFQVQHGTQKS